MYVQCVSYFLYNVMYFIEVTHNYYFYMLFKMFCLICSLSSNSPCSISLTSQTILNSVTLECSSPLLSFMFMETRYLSHQMHVSHIVAPLSLTLAPLLFIGLFGHYTCMSASCYMHCCKLTGVLSSMLIVLNYLSRKQPTKISVFLFLFFFLFTKGSLFVYFMDIFNSLQDSELIRGLNMSLNLQPSTASSLPPASLQRFLRGNVKTQNPNFKGSVLASFDRRFKSRYTNSCTLQVKCTVLSIVKL